MWKLFPLFLILQGSCAHPLPRAPGPERITLEPDLDRRWYVPLMARNSDYVCVETVGSYPNFCARVGDLRIWIAKSSAN